MAETPRIKPKPAGRHLLMALLCIPLTYGVVFFLRLYHEQKVNPERYLDSPASYGVGIAYAAILVIPALIAMAVLLMKSGNDTPRK